MTKKPEGWRNDPYRHGLASKGIKTVLEPWKSEEWTAERYAKEFVPDYELDEYDRSKRFLDGYITPDGYIYFEKDYRKGICHRYFPNAMEHGWIRKTAPPSYVDNAMTYEVPGNLEYWQEELIVEDMLDFSDKEDMTFTLQTADGVWRVSMEDLEETGFDLYEAMRIAEREGRMLKENGMRIQYDKESCKEFFRDMKASERGRKK